MKFEWIIMLALGLAPASVHASPKPRPLAPKAIFSAPSPSPTASPTPETPDSTAPSWADFDRRYRASYFYSAHLAADLQGHHDEALILLERASQADPESIHLLRELGEKYELHERGGDAIRVLKKILQLQPDDDELRQNLARLYIRAGKNLEARSLFEAAKGGDAADKASLRALAAMDMAENKWDEAVKRLSPWIKSHADAKEEREMLAAALIKLERKAEAVEQYEAVLLAEPGRAEAAYRLAHLYESMGENENAIVTLQDAIDASPDSALLKDALARTYYRQEKFAEAEIGFSELLAENGDDTESLLFRGMSRLQGKKFKEAQSDFLRLGEMQSSNPSQLYGLGLAQLWQDKLSEAEQTFQKLIGIHPKAVPAYTQLAFIYDRTSRTAEAVTLLEKGVKENPESPELYLLLGSAALDTGDRDRAEKTFIKGIKATGNSTALRFQLAVLYDRDGKFESAEKELGAIIEIEPSNAQALNYLGYSWVDRGVKLNEAEALIRRALAVEPDNHYYQDSLGWACYKLGRYEEAKLALKKAAAIQSPGPEEWIVFEHLAKVYEKLGETQNARANFERALQLKPKP